MNKIILAIIFLAGLGCGTYLALHDHPWFGLFIVIISGCVGDGQGGDNDEEGGA